MNMQPDATASISTTILSLANDVRDAARNISHRSGSLADCLGGIGPESGNGDDPEPTDLHGILQRVLTTLRVTQLELMRSERVVGIATPTTPLKTATGGQRRVSAFLGDNQCQPQQ